MNKQDRIELLSDFEKAPDTALFSQKTIAAVRDCSTATLERDRWAGTGIPFVKFGHSVKYRKSDVMNWLNKHVARQSTSAIVK
ncbi:MAG: hypothetical protein PHH11_07035 [Methylomonas sp.]|nr:hypothetical protein [Methylomonas sp.]